MTCLVGPLQGSFNLREAFRDIESIFGEGSFVEFVQKDIRPWDGQIVDLEPRCPVPTESAAPFLDQAECDRDHQLKYYHKVPDSGYCTERGYKQSKHHG